jgi:hypothetical protein
MSIGDKNDFASLMSFHFFYVYTYQQTEVKKHISRGRVFNGAV